MAYKLPASKVHGRSVRRTGAVRWLRGKFALVHWSTSSPRTFQRCVTTPYTMRLFPDEDRRHLFKALFHAHFGHFHHLALLPAVFDDGDFCRLVVHRFERHRTPHILWKIRRKAHLCGVDLIAVLVGQVLDEYNPLHRNYFLVVPCAVLVAEAELW